MSEDKKIEEIDITEIAKQRLELKAKVRKFAHDGLGLPNTPALNDKIDALTDEELSAAMLASRDARLKGTGLKDQEVLPGLSMHPRVVEFVTSGPQTGDMPNDGWRRGIAHKQRKLNNDIEEDLKISKKIVESMVEKKVVQESQREAAATLLAGALQRERDKELVFVPVSGLDPRSAAKRVIRLKEEYNDVEPVDLTGVLDDVNPICDLHIEKLQNIMNVKKALNLDEGVPDEIRFVIPNIDLPAPSETDPGDIKFAMTRYVHFDSMPAELQAVVRSYLSLRRGIDTLASRRFRKAITELAHKAEATFDDDGGPEAA